MLQTIICRSSRGTKGQSAGATSISPSSSRPSLIESMRCNCRLFSRFTRWTFRVGTAWFLHYCSDVRPFSPENHSKSLATNDFQPSHSHLIAEAPEKGGSYEIDPRGDLVPLCPNCHRMVHHTKGAPLTVEELRLRLKNVASQGSLS
jgi:hypothetical protein